ncbi:hypothetical protein M413DRAFT_437856 [Hebeloma cylindrosporum]|uniref:CENP-C homolog n=1 Tax=Hebeloma cylindrosporum TaxID=76867 RepID=A0A0C2Z677_HEBCY|nr:hypothetical protein M413DRAFT_437856 [Hebeloma cylindrosporum h7]
MPTSARKSSVGGARRGPQKAHVPYRGDNPEVGKKTGITVQHVERKSDGFEPFEELLQQADGRTPPRPKGRKKSLAMMGRHDEDYDEEDGEMSMQIDSPVQHLVNMRPPTTPTTSARSRSSIRPVARTSDVDFDKIPSPRPLNSTQRSSRNAGPGPSSLSKFTRARESTPDDPQGEEGEEYDYGEDNMVNGGFDDYGPQETPPNSSPQRGRGRPRSFSRIEEDEEQDEEQEQEDEEDQEKTPTQSKRDKGKGRAVREESREPSEEVEDEIAQGLEDVGLSPGSDEEEEDNDQEPQPPVKKARVESPKKPGRKTKSTSKKENREYREGTRKSSRNHYAPLEWWRGEKIVYGKTNSSGRVLVAPIKEIVRIPKDMPLPLGAKRKRGSTRPRSRSRALNDEEVIAPALPVANPEEGWDDETTTVYTVLRYTDREEADRRVAYPARMFNPKLAGDGSWFFDKVFSDDEFIAAGQLVIPPTGRKPSKAAKDNTYVFYVIEGAINFKIHNTSMILTTGGSFMVPRGNTYLIENISNRDAKLFFTQARKVVMTDEERAARELHIAETQKRKSMVRSSSAGAPSTGPRPVISPGGARSKSLAAPLRA